MEQLIQAKGSQAQVVASIGDAATSGGYFLASSAGYIFAPASAHIGAVGAFEVKFDFHRLLQRLGIHAYSRGIGSHSLIESWCHTRSANERATKSTEIAAFQRDFIDLLVQQRRLQPDVIAAVRQGAS